MMQEPMRNFPAIRVHPWLKILSPLTGHLHPKKIKQLAIMVKTAGLF
jgi:hypothetical protein